MPHIAFRQTQQAFFEPKAAVRTRKKRAACAEVIPSAAIMQTDRIAGMPAATPYHEWTRFPMPRRMADHGRMRRGARPGPMNRRRLQARLPAFHFGKFKDRRFFGFLFQFVQGVDEGFGAGQDDVGGHPASLHLLGVFFQMDNDFA